jgi:hypothetical protein
MMMNPYTFGLFNASLSYDKLFPESKNFPVPQYLLVYYSLLTVSLLVLVVLVDEHQFRKVFIKHEEFEEN